MKKLLYVVAALPGDNAPTKHALAIAELFSRIGWSCSLLAVGLNRVAPDHPEDYDFRGWNVHQPRSLRSGVASVPDKVLEELFSKTSIRSFKDFVAGFHPDAVLYYGIPCRLAREIVTLCADIPVLVDETDWFEYHFSFDIRSFLFDKHRSDRVLKVDGLTDGVISISPFFFDYFTDYAVHENVALKNYHLPPLNPSDEPRVDFPSKPKERRIETRFMYAGSIGGRKDRILPFIESLRRAKDKYQTKPVLDVFGVSAKKAKEDFGLEEDESILRFHGRVPHEAVIRNLREADWGILLRYPELYARAGFSTKFAECMSNGVPMIANKVGGAEVILENGLDGLVIPDCEARTLDELLEKTCNMSDEELYEIKNRAYEKAGRLFEIDGYVQSFSAFIDEVCSAKDVTSKGCAVADSSFITN
ncbi:MAG: glycosyltransferase family 4 protein [Collinsella stercoris]|nr:glycosyltransferase family 4 protein [Collinsella stercoris]